MQSIQISTLVVTFFIPYITKEAPLMVKDLDGLGFGVKVSCFINSSKIMVLCVFWTKIICHMVATSAHFIQTKHENLNIIIMFDDIQWHHSSNYNFMPHLWSLNSSFTQPHFFNSLILQVCNFEYALSLSLSLSHTQNAQADLKLDTPMTMNLDDFLATIHSI